MDSNLTLTLFFPWHPNLSPFPHTRMLRKKSILVRSSNRFLALPKYLTLLLSFFFRSLALQTQKGVASIRRISRQLCWRRKGRDKKSAWHWENKEMMSVSQLHSDSHAKKEEMNFFLSSPTPNLIHVHTLPHTHA